MFDGLVSVTVQWLLHGKLCAIIPLAVLDQSSRMGPREKHTVSRGHDFPEHLCYETWLYRIFHSDQ